MLRCRPRPTVLELGGGCLRNALYLQKLGCRVTVLEVSGVEERFPKEYCRFRRLGGIVVSTMPQTGLFDIALATFVIETICAPRERKELLCRARVLLRPGGYLLLSVRGPADVLTAQGKGEACSDGFITPNRTFSRPYTRRQLSALLKDCGFRRQEYLHRKSTKAPELLHVIAREDSEL